MFSTSISLASISMTWLVSVIVGNMPNKTASADCRVLVMSDDRTATIDGSYSLGRISFYLFNN